MGGNNYGLNDSLKYFEFELDSLDNSGAYNSSAAPTDWPLFQIVSEVRRTEGAL